jgi:hypothetical protein
VYFWSPGQLKNDDPRFMIRYSAYGASDAAISWIWSSVSMEIVSSLGRKGRRFWIHVFHTRMYTGATTFRSSQLRLSSTPVLYGVKKAFNSWKVSRLVKGRLGNRNTPFRPSFSRRQGPSYAPIEGPADVLIERLEKIIWIYGLRKCSIHCVSCQHMNGLIIEISRLALQIQCSKSIFGETSIPSLVQISGSSVLINNSS